MRAELAAGHRLVGTFVKLANADVVEMAADAGFDFVVVDLEHSTLTEADAIGLVRHADVCGIPALVRVPAVEPALIARLLENGAVGIQLSMLRTAEQARRLVAATRFAPSGERSVSLANRVAGFGAASLRAFLRSEAEAPPMLVGQIETAIAEPWPDVLHGLDVAFVGTTDLSVSLGLPSSGELSAQVELVASAARAAGAAFGGWSASVDAASAQGLAGAGYLIVGSDLQILAAGLRAAMTSERGN
ncbi:aldolase/citrate lyase family protein [Dactylosporangium sp. NPDC000555]|uniref:HpcH/HpaI aldolase family protein n=1 Tax=Dactylosporangium sp. NPDC000555 TaxID=3154260 RepID=UPI00331C6006